jgi:hypothetical protein
VLNNSRCHGAPAAYACALTSHNRRGDAYGVFCRSALRLYDSTDRELVSAVQLRVRLWSVKQRATEVESSLFLRFITRKRLVEDTAEE